MLKHLLKHVDHIAPISMYPITGRWSFSERTREIFHLPNLLNAAMTNSMRAVAEYGLTEAFTPLG